MLNSDDGLIATYFNCKGLSHETGIICFLAKDYLTFPMKLALLTFVFILGVTATAQARLGENPDQLVARYGQPLSENDQKPNGDKIALADVIFQKGGFRIEVTVTDGISVKEVYSKLNGNPLGINEVRALLTDNAQGYDWQAPHMVRGDKWWVRDDNATAQLAQDGSLTIKSRELVAKENTAKRLEARPSLDGF